MNDEQSARAAADLYARAMTDAEFKAQLVADPASVMRAEGLDVPEGMEIKVVENSSSTVYVVLPDPETFSDEILAAASGGGEASTFGTASLSLSSWYCY
jgi:hypothetical protein